MEDIEIVDSKIGKIFDSRGNPAIEATIFLNYASGTSSAPAGASTGKTEVIAYPENNIENSIDFYNRHVRNALKGFNALNQSGFDTLLHELDGTDNFSPTLLWTKML